MSNGSIAEPLCIRCQRVAVVPDFDMCHDCMIQEALVIPAYRSVGSPPDSPAAALAVAQPDSSSAPPQSADSQSRIPGYRLVRFLGEGAMGRVYFAYRLHEVGSTRTEVAEPVAVKVIRRERLARRPDAIANFAREATVMQALRHPHIIQVIDFDLEGEIPYLAMPWCEGGRLTDYLERVMDLARHPWFGQRTVASKPPQSDATQMPSESILRSQSPGLGTDFSRSTDADTDADADATPSSGLIRIGMHQHEPMFLELSEDDLPNPNLQANQAMTWLNESLLATDAGQRQVLRTFVGWIADIANGMNYVHAMRISHLDIKPDNLLVVNETVIQVTDFGIAFRSQSLDQAHNLERGTPPFIPPEQFHAYADANERGTPILHDIYSLGTTLYCCLTLSMPFIAMDDQGNPKLDDQGKILIDRDAKRANRFPTPRALCPKIPRDLEAICLRAMATDPASRYPSMAEFEQDLRHYLANRPVTARPASMVHRARLWRRRNPSLSIAIGLSLVALMTVSIAIVRAIRSEFAVLTAENRIREQENQILTAELKQASEENRRQFVQLAEDASHRGNWDEALRLTDRALQHADDPLPLQVGRIPALLALNRQFEAQDELRRLSETVQTPELQGLVQFYQADLVLWEPTRAKEGQRLLEQAIQNGLPPAELATAKGLLASKTRESIQCFRDALGHDPYCHRARTHLILSHLFVCDLEVTQQEIQRFRELYPHDGFADLADAWQALLSLKLDEIPPYLDAFLAKRPDVDPKPLREFFQTFGPVLKDAVQYWNSDGENPLVLFKIASRLKPLSSQSSGQFAALGYGSPIIQRLTRVIPIVSQSLANRIWGPSQAAVQKMREEYAQHPEALLLYTAAILQLDIAVTTSTAGKVPETKQALLELADLNQLGMLAPSLLQTKNFRWRFRMLNCVANGALLTLEPDSSPERERQLHDDLRLLILETREEVVFRDTFPIVLQAVGPARGRLFLLDWIEDNARDIRPLRLLARLEFKAGNLAEARKRTEQALALAPNDQEARELLQTIDAAPEMIPVAPRPLPDMK
ncbi:serine/threonine-protein kinase [Tuwongella immobilis]|uniref:Protein kinase domain-containing protein n=1 Tax=Tuwongella immobilis TaxID=692036 RepID=A0A6C2YVQ4_9BACT|nr:serine/threonine-protein kinase [Tuwongella immobilis]VIP05524.1 serine threonine protein kinase : Serine/threonine protein kinase OS=Rhodopirellula maiorica SM1 GN=RMSM_02836 PE=4 SV=1: Pkinase_Tyr: TPR_2 [Tuwongella immobilis]VTS08404.1 serine threonine protein kinase : Serine/threonine protein kinase OS=Rhodopirellula maiorica SM1 GN=RMSM_02836 PE=4 SV=1: Pkinase_Tyr: TPR_2 [Tuwongella immobilis]